MGGKEAMELLEDLGKTKVSAEVKYKLKTAIEVSDLKDDLEEELDDLIDDVDHDLNTEDIAKAAVVAVVQLISMYN